MNDNGETVIINPKLCNRLTIQVEIEQKHEEPIPHVHVYHDKTRNSKKCSCVCLNKAEYCAAHGYAPPLPPKLKNEFILLMTTAYTRPSTCETITGFEIAVDKWVETYEDDCDKFAFDENNHLIMPDYTKL